MNQNNQNKPNSFFLGEPFKRVVIILITMVTILATVVTLLEGAAGRQTTQAIHLSQQYGMEAIGSKAVGEMEVGYAWSEAYRRWLEWNTLANFAEINNEIEAAIRYKLVRDRTQEFSALLNAPYFDPETGQAPNIRAFEADTYLVETTMLAERFAAATELIGEWENKQAAYVTQLLLLAISLFLYGLSVTSVGKIRRIFVTMGSVIAGAVILWMAVTYVMPVNVFPEQAIIAYSQGVGQAHQNKHDQAIKLFDQALDIAPNYANAYYARAKSYSDQGDLTQATNNYVAAINAGRTDIAAPWNLGWTYYLIGQPDKAIKTTQIALEMDEMQVALHFNLGLAHLAKGNPEAAQAAYTSGIDLARQQIAGARDVGQEPSSSLWWYLNTAAIDLDNFVTCLSTRVCRDTPPFDTLDTSDSLQSTAAGLRMELKNAAVALEYLDQPSSETAIAAAIENVKFEMIEPEEVDYLAEAEVEADSDDLLRGGEFMEQEGEEIDTNITHATSANTSEIRILFNYDGMADGQLLTIKIYKDGRESTGLRLIETWDWGKTGETNLVLTPGDQFALLPGEYRVEIYVEAQLIQESVFTITEDQELKK